MLTKWWRAKTVRSIHPPLWQYPGWSSDFKHQQLIAPHSSTVSLRFVFVSQDNRRKLLVQCLVHSILHLTSLGLGLVLDPLPRWGRRGLWPRCLQLRSWPDGHGDAGDGVRRPCLVLVSSLCRQIPLAGATRRRYALSSSCSSSHGRTKSWIDNMEQLDDLSFKPPFWVLEAKSFCSCL